MRSSLALARRKNVHALSAVILAFALPASLCAASPAVETRRAQGESYARAFSDAARGYVTVWDDVTCAFIESVPESTAMDGPVVTQVSVIPLAGVTVAVRSRTARAMTLDVTFRCAPPPRACIARTRKDGAMIISSDPIAERTIALRATTADVSRVTAELEQLRAACSAYGRDGGV